MRRNTKNLLIAAIVFAVIVVIAVWYITYPRMQYIKYSTLRSITFTPPQSTASNSSAAANSVDSVDSVVPVLTFTFSAPIDPDSVKDTSASIHSFILDPDTPESVIDLAQKIIKNGVPFTPIVANPTTIISTSMPTVLNAITDTLTMNGSGEMWFAVPPKT